MDKQQEVTDDEWVKMFSVINGFSGISKMGYSHLKKYPEDRQGVIDKYYKFIQPE